LVSPWSAERDPLYESGWIYVLLPGQERGTVQCGCELPDVSRPGVLKEGRVRAGTNCTPASRREVRCKWQEIFTPLSERWEMDDYACEPLKEVAPEHTGVQGVRKSVLGCGDGPKPHRPLSRVHNATYFSCFEDTEELRLCVQRETADLVEKQCSAGRRFDQAW
jgi:hypothetical protein